MNSMNRELIHRIDEILKRRGESRSGASIAAGLGESYIRDLERKKGSPNLAKLSQLASYFGATLDDLLPNSNIDHAIKASVTSLPVVGKIAAGHFMDITLVDQDEDYPVINVASDTRFSHAKQYALLVTGSSMDLKFPDGCYVTCVDFVSSGLHLKPGMTVHVERTIAGTHLVENTLKEIQSINGEMVLIPRSSDPKFGPIIIHGDESTEFVIRGVVTGKWEPQIF